MEKKIRAVLHALSLVAGNEHVAGGRGEQVRGTHWPASKRLHAREAIDREPIDEGAGWPGPVDSQAGNHSEQLAGAFCRLCGPRQ